MYEALLQAYRETEYRGFNDSHIVLLIDQFNKASDALLVDRDVTTAAFITAWNPHSKPVSKSENDIAQARLQSEVMSPDWITCQAKVSGAMALGRRNRACSFLAFPLIEPRSYQKPSSRMRSSG